MYLTTKPYFGSPFKRTICFLFILCFQFCFYKTKAQPGKQHDFKFQHVNKELNNSQIISICEDYYGYLWIRTLSGLHRFDGNDFEVFFSTMDSTSIQENRIETIY